MAAESVITEAEPDAYELYQTRAEDEQKLFIRETVRRIFGFEGREGQIKAIHHLLFKQSDLVLIAKTSFGKSLIFQAVSAIRKRSITIIIIPLTRVGQGQYEKLRQLEGCNPCLLTAKTSSKSIFQRMKRGDFSHILTSPELAVSEPFRELCVDPGFGDRVSMVAIDEFHLVAQWGRDWRPEYARCHVLRDRLGPQVRWFACSATLDERTLRMAMTDTSFTDETCIMRHSIDRPELSLCVFKIPSCTMSRYDALFFLIKPGRSANGLATPMEIPKTVVFLDSRVGVQAACKALRGMLLKYCDKYTPAEVQRRIGVYHANLADVDKDSYYADFQTVQSNRRIIVATDALGLGVDISDISVVVQYGIPRSDGLSAIMQRWGRAARGRNRTGIVALLAEDWSFVTPATDSQRGIARSMLCRRNKQSQLSQVSLVGDATNEDGDEGGQDDDDATDDIVQGAAENELPASQQKKRLSRAERLHTLPKEVREFINSTDCRRILMLKHFDDPVIARETVAGCCDNCDPSLCNLYATLPPQLKKPSTRKPHASSPAGVLIAKITEWAEEKTHAPRFEKLVTALSVNNFFPAKLISRIAVECTQTSIITDRLSFDQQIREWDYVDEYGAELWDLVKDNIAGQPEFDRSIGIDHQSTPSGTQIRPIQLADWSDVINQRLNNGDVDLQMSLPGIQSPPLLSAPATPHARLEASEFSPSLGRLRMMRNFLTPVRSDTMQRTAV